MNLNQCRNEVDLLFATISNASAYIMWFTVAVEQIETRTLSPNANHYDLNKLLVENRQFFENSVISLIFAACWPIFLIFREITKPWKRGGFPNILPHFPIDWDSIIKKSRYQQESNLKTQQNDWKSSHTITNYKLSHVFLSAKGSVATWHVRPQTCAQLDTIKAGLNSHRVMNY